MERHLDGKCHGNIIVDDNPTANPYRVKVCYVLRNDVKQRLSQHVEQSFALRLWHLEHVPKCICVAIEHSIGDAELVAFAL